MDINQLTAWVAGYFEATGAIIIGTDQGPSGKTYATIEVDVILSPHNRSGERFLQVAGNGTLEDTSWRLGGYAAVRGFVETLWPYLTKDSKQYINTELKRFKLKKAEVRR